MNISSFKKKKPKHQLGLFQQVFVRKKVPAAKKGKVYIFI